MINLIPPDAQTLIVTEYWYRVLAVWLLLVAAAGLLVAFMILPAYVLVTGQVRAYAQTAAESKKEQVLQSEATAALSKATGQAQAVMATIQVPRLVAVYDAIASRTDPESITIKSYLMSRKVTAIGEVKVEGYAKTRKDLIVFRDSLIAHAAITRVDLPINNLTKERDIQFSLTVVMATTTPAL